MTSATSQQTIGPFWHGLADEDWCDLTRFGGDTGERRPLILTGRIVDGNGALVTDACIETWQTSPPASDTFPGWGRCATNAEGTFRIRTLIPDDHPAQAPHITVLVHARGLLKPLLTRAYFANHPMNERDPVLQSIDPARRPTLLAHPVGEARWQFDIRLQGENETVFFEV
ncbi:protocatechuate 3,4-dioxygenase subunit alpha [Pendulispora rubella]|uniref:Protocatechuate 3,4-dioxygenase subunit alpha n=1 Tax=Pendulispora rubella TaxID=2741070 RepID=A0ABZ2L0A0_9BACT